MGNDLSNIDHSSFDADEIRRLRKRFRKLDEDGSGSISIEEVLAFLLLMFLLFFLAAGPA